MNLSVSMILAGAGLLEGVTEQGGPNRGPAVERILASTGNPPGDPWCASYVYRVGSAMMGAAWPLPRTASCDVLLEHARKRGLLREEPRPGDVFLVMKHDHDAIHTGFVTGWEGAAFTTLEGNTNPNGGREGYGVFRRRRGGPSDRTRYQFIRWTL